ILNNDSLRPSCLEQHLTKDHSTLIEKPKEFFAAKLQNLKCMNLDTTGAFHQVSAKAVEASYELSLLITKAKKMHIIRETLVKPFLLKAADIVFGVESKKNLSEILLSDHSVKCHINELAKDLELQVVEAVLASPFFSIQCDDTTDVAQCCQLLVFVRLTNNGTVKEELLFSKELMTTSKASDFMKKTSDIFEKNRLLWGKLAGVCTDGAPAMPGSCSGFVTLGKEKNLAVTTTYCVIQRQSLAAKTLPDDLCDSLNLAIIVVNVKNSALNMRLFDALCMDLGVDQKTLLFHPEVRWLSKGNMPSRLFELKDEVEVFLKQQKKEQLYHAFTDQTFQLSLAYLVVIFKSLNNLSLKLQGNNAANIIAHHAAIKAFMEKSPALKTLNTSSDKEDVKNKIVFHLDCLSDEFIRYFPDNFSGKPIHKLVRNPFNTDVDSLPEVLQYSSAKDNLENTSLEEFWIKYFSIYSKVGEEALHIILPFSSMYLCEKSFSSLITLKIKQRNRLDVEKLHCALATIKPRISQLVKKMQHHPSH
uniref:Uncharacterized protein n=1 Tax=Pelodiscus sinensis TaxID=13735 RepID=K7FPW1_PELSI